MSHEAVMPAYVPFPIVELALGTTLAIDLARHRDLHLCQTLAVDDESPVTPVGKLPIGSHHDMNVRVCGVPMLSPNPRRQTFGPRVPSQLGHDRSSYLPQVQTASVLGRNNQPVVRASAGASVN